MGNTMYSVVKENCMLMLELCVDKRGYPVYRISWYQNGKWAYARYDSFTAAMATWKMLTKMV